MVATVGRIELHPNLVNVVAERALLTVDLRHTDDTVLSAAEAALDVLCDELREREGVTIDARSLARFAPVQFDHAVIDLVEQVADRLGRSTKRMPSGAGHDAQMLARVCPSGMVFVPSAGGVSHNPAEHTDDDQLAAGADVLLQVMLELAGAR
jgi:N-carbamoyl-L-amino-acid hydrolase